MLVVVEVVVIMADLVQVVQEVAALAVPVLLVNLLQTSAAMLISPQVLVVEVHPLIIQKVVQVVPVSL
jgi:hypothetical protein